MPTVLVLLFPFFISRPSYVHQQFVAFLPFASLPQSFAFRLRPNELQFKLAV